MARCHDAAHTHCKNTIPKIRNKYFQKRNCTATVTISTFMCLWLIYIFQRLICLFCCRKICGLILGIYNTRTDTWMWKLGLRPRNSQKGIHKWDFCCSARHGSHNTTLLPTIGTPLTGYRRELCREAGRDPDNLNRVGSSLVERLGKLTKSRRHKEGHL
jgi:hypothetical protein